MTEDLAKSCTAFEGLQLLLSGPLAEVVLAVKAATERGATEPILTFDDATGHVIDLDLRGTEADVIERLSQASPGNGGQASARRGNGLTASGKPSEVRGRGRPRLGVVGHEVTLLPRQWEWLAAQPGGASVALRKLVDEAKRTGSAVRETRQAQEVAYRFMSAMAGNLSGFEEATRALFANDPLRFAQHVATWPEGVRAYATRLAFDTPAEGVTTRTRLR
jgi:hypothetical protein